MTGDRPAARARSRKIPTSRLLVGILLHFCVPVYLLLCLTTGLLVQPTVSGWDQAPGRMLWTAGWFVPGLLVVMGMAAMLGALLDRHADRRPDITAEAQVRVRDGVRALAALADSRLARALAQVEGAAWDHADARYQQVAADLDAAARTFAVAIASAEPARRPAILALAADSVERLAAALDTLAAERRRLDEGDAQTVAGYIDARYR